MHNQFYWRLQFKKKLKNNKRKKKERTKGVIFICFSLHKVITSYLLIIKSVCALNPNHDHLTCTSEFEACLLTSLDITHSANDIKLRLLHWFLLKILKDIICHHFWCLKPQLYLFVRMFHLTGCFRKLDIFKHRKYRKYLYLKRTWYHILFSFFHVLSIYMKSV